MSAATHEISTERKKSYNSLKHSTKKHPAKILVVPSNVTFYIHSKANESRRWLNDREVRSWERNSLCLSEISCSPIEAVANVQAGNQPTNQPTNQPASQHWQRPYLFHLGRPCGEQFDRLNCRRAVSNTERVLCILCAQRAKTTSRTSPISTVCWVWDLEHVEEGWMVLVTLAVPLPSRSRVSLRVTLGPCCVEIRICLFRGPGERSPWNSTFLLQRNSSSRFNPRANSWPVGPREISLQTFRRPAVPRWTFPERFFNGNSHQIPFVICAPTMFAVNTLYR